MTTERKKRARGIASDEAHAWARSLELKNADAKNVLRALAVYCNSQGSCFVGIDQLALDTDLSTDTVRRRLVWLEEIGAIKRVAQFIDRFGRRNPISGKRTTDEIVLLMGHDDTIEARARGENVAENEAISSAFSPSSQQGQNDDQPSVSPRLALAVEPPPNPLNHEPEIAVADDARATISKPALDLAEQLLVISGHSPEFWPPGWCGAPLRVQTWLNGGWTPDVIVAATRAAMARKTGPPPNSVQFFEKAIAEEVMRQSRPLPEVKDVPAARKSNSGPDRSTASAYDRLRQRLGADQDLAGGGDGSGPSAGRLLAPGRGS